MLEREVRAILAGIVKNGVSADLVAAAKLQERRGRRIREELDRGPATTWSEAAARARLLSP